jgi:hypothetical protein
MPKNDDKVISLGIIIEDLSASQKCIEFISHANDFILHNVDVDLCVFTSNIVPPCIKPSFPTLSTRDLYSFEGVVVATSVVTLQAAKESNASHLFHYIYYPEFLSHNALYRHHQLNHWYTLPDVTRFARCLDYKDVVEEEFGCKVLDEVLPFFKLGDLLNIIRNHTT